MRIRPAVSTDVPSVLPMVAQICSLHESWDRAKYGFLPDPASRYHHWLTEQTKGDRGLFLVADPEVSASQENSALAGFLVATVEREIPIYRLREYAFIHDLWVEPAYRSAGVGRQLVETALQLFSQRGIHQVRLDTAAINETARRLFQSCGFRVSTIEMLVELDRQQ
jgi:ribosomal protein S18 acetylase RimI-like enzyme